MKKGIKILALVGSLMLASCGNNDNTGTSIDTSIDETSSNGGSTNSSAQVGDVYNVVIHSATGVTITSDKATAAQGETVTLTVVESAGFTLLTLTCNDEALTVSNGTASFTMPDQDVDIRATVQASGEITVGGGTAAQMEETSEGSGVYVARNVSIESTTDIYIAIADSDGSFTPIGYNELNRYKCFGSITFSDTTYAEYDFPKGAEYSVGRSSLINIGGNAAYDIYYDTTNSTHPIYIQRVKVLNLPQSYATYEELWSGSIKSEASTYPFNVKKVNYYDNRTGVDYEFNMYDDSSLAVISDHETDEELYYVYKSIDDGIYTVVDNYLENVTYTSPYPYYGGSKTVYIDDSKTEDNTAYSGEYDIVDEVAQGYSSWQISQEEAEFDVGWYSHDMYSLDRLMWMSYRDSFTIADDLTLADRSITSVDNGDGTFTTTIDSYKVYNPTSTSTYNTMTSAVRIDYDATITFTEAGAPLSGTFSEKMYTSSQYDFSTNTFLTGGESGGTRVKYVTFSYEYGEPNSGKPDFDYSKYFATGISATIGTDNTVQGGWSYKEEDEDYLLSVVATGDNASTALDTWQYIPTATSDSTLFVPDSYSPTELVAVTNKGGTATLTIGKWLKTQKITLNIDVTIELMPFRSLYMWERYTSDWHLTTATTASMYANSTWTIYLETNPYQATLAGITPVCDVEGVLDVSIDSSARTITYVAGNVTSTTVVNVTLNSDNYMEDWKDSPTVFTITISPAAATGFSETSIPGTYRVEYSSDNASSYDTTDPTVLTFDSTATGTSNGYTTYSGTLQMNDEDWVATYSFTWYYNSNAQSLNISGFSMTAGTATDFQYYTVYNSLEFATGKIGLIVFGENIVADSENGGMNSATSEILGSASYDDEGWLEEDSSSYVFFVKVS